MKLTPKVKNVMVIGDILQSVSVRNNVSNVSGLGSYISSYFESTATQQQYKPNREWNDPINKNAKGMFWVYYQNVHGVSHDDTTVLLHPNPVFLSIESRMGEPAQL
jgi:hypothetical protein